MKKVAILGCPGSGKSTFAKKLQNLTGIPLFHLDLIWHKPDKTTISRDEFDKILDEIMQKDSWIIDGNYSRTIPLRLKKCDTVFLFDLPLDVCLEGAMARVGTKRTDLPWIENQLDEEFKQYIIDFPSAQLPKIYELLQPLQKEKNIIIFKTRNDTDRFIERLKKSL